jgi:hypothetical protein
MHYVYGDFALTSGILGFKVMAWRQFINNKTDGIYQQLSAVSQILLTYLYVFEAGIRCRSRGSRGQDPPSHVIKGVRLGTDPPNFQTKKLPLFLLKQIRPKYSLASGTLNKSDVVQGHHQRSSIRMMSHRLPDNYRTVPALWNSLPAELHIHASDTSSTSPFASSTAQFLRKFKTCLFHHSCPP